MIGLADDLLPSGPGSGFSSTFEGKFSDWIIGSNEKGLDECLCRLMESLIAGKVDADQLVALFRTAKQTVGEGSSSLLLLDDGVIAALSTYCFIAMDGDKDGYKRLCELIRQLVIQNIVPKDALKLRLELNTLIDAGILGSKESRDEDLGRFKNRLTKINTNLVYRQQKYNLHREETEGYSKVVVSVHGFPVYPQDATSEVSQLRQIIGQFDLDPNRVLDIILESFEKRAWNLNFVFALRELNYKDEYITQIIGFRFGNYRVVGQSSCNDTDTNMESSDDVDENEKDRGGGNGDKAAKPSGTRGAAKIKEEETASAFLTTIPSNCTPASLFGLAAVLLSHGFLKVEKLIPYLKPTADEASKNNMIANGKRKGELRSMGVVNLNANTSSTSKDIDTGVSNSFDDNATDAMIEKAERDAIPDWNESKNRRGLDEIELAYGATDQLVGLCSALINIRCWDAALLLLDFLKGLGIDAVANSSVQETLSDLTGWMISDLYEMHSLKRLGLSGAFQQQDNDFPETGCKGQATDHISAIEVVPRMPNQLEKIQGGEGDSIRNFPDLVSPFLFRLGSHIHKNAHVFTQVCRLLRLHVEMVMKETDGDSRHESLLPSCSILARVLLPALSCSANIPYYSSLIWDSISLFPYDMRFNIYNLWKGKGLGKDGATDRTKHFECCVAEAAALLGAKAKLKRLTKENMRLIGKQLAGFSTTNPLVVYSLILNQVTVYENLIPFVVGALAISTTLSRDVMACCILTHLNRDKDKQDSRVKEGDTSVSSGFSLLSKFIATFYRRFPSVEMKGLLHYLVKRCEDGDSLDLLVLKDLLYIMGGAGSLTDVSSSQLEGLAGGKALRLEVIGGSSKEAQSKKAIESLRRELVESKTALPMIIYMDKLRKKIIYDEGLDNLKLISHLYDTTQDLLMQFTEFLVSGDLNQLESVALTIPYIDDLILEHGLDIQVAFQLVRPLIRAALQHGTDFKAAPKWLRRWHPLHSQITGALEKVLGTAHEKCLTTEMLVLFWCCSLTDIHVPEQRYETEIKRLRDRLEDLSHPAKVATKSRDKPNPVAVAEADKERRNQLIKTTQLVEEIENEFKAQKVHVANVHSIIMDKRQSFFSGSTADASSVVDYIIQDVVHKRCLMSPIDAVYSSRFFTLVNSMGEASVFSTVQFADRAMRFLSPLLFCTTETESGFLGYTIRDLLTYVCQWVDDKDSYTRNAMQGDAFSATLMKGSVDIICNNAERDREMLLEEVTAGDAEADTDGKGNTQYMTVIAPGTSGRSDPLKLSHEEYIHWCMSWHDSLCKLILTCLDSSEYMHIRSALVFLVKVSDKFPIWYSGGKELLERIEAIEQHEVDRPDLQLMSRSLKAILMMRSKEWLDEDGKVVVPVRPKPAPRSVVVAPALKKANNSAVAKPVVVRKQAAPAIVSSNNNKSDKDNRKSGSVHGVVGDKRKDGGDKKQQQQQQQRTKEEKELRDKILGKVLRADNSDSKSNDKHEKDRGRDQARGGQGRERERSPREDQRDRDRSRDGPVDRRGGGERDRGHDRDLERAERGGEWDRNRDMRDPRDVRGGGGSGREGERGRDWGREKGTAYRGPSNASPQDYYPPHSGGDGFNHDNRGGRYPASGRDHRDHQDRSGGGWGGHARGGAGRGSQQPRGAPEPDRGSRRDRGGEPEPKRRRH
jgi:THO complex subunit 2